VERKVNRQKDGENGDRKGDRKIQGMVERKKQQEHIERKREREINENARYKKE
jgi:hypothetical protein